MVIVVSLHYLVSRLFSVGHLYKTLNKNVSVQMVAGTVSTKTEVLLGKHIQSDGVC